MNSVSFTDPDAWAGGFYELATRLGNRDDVRLQQALGACTAYPAITGWYQRRDVDPSEQERITPTVADLERCSHLFGFASVPGYPPLVCGCLAIHYEPGDIESFHVYIPIGALSHVDARVGSFPFGYDGGPVSLAWRVTLDPWFADLARFIYSAVPFELGLIGLEDSGGEALADNADTGIVPEIRDCMWLVPHEGELRSYPATV